jgi:hypothetical protein
MVSSGCVLVRDADFLLRLRGFVSTFLPFPPYRSRRQLSTQSVAPAPGPVQAPVSAPSKPAGSWTAFSQFAEGHAKAVGLLAGAAGLLVGGAVAITRAQSQIWIELAQKDVKLAEKDTNLERSLRLLEEKNHNKHLDLIAHGDYLEFRNRMAEKKPKVPAGETSETKTTQASSQ